MNEIPLCNLIISSEVPKEEIEALTESIKLTSAQVQKKKSRVVGLDDIALLITIAVGGAQLTEYSIKIAQAINRWRRKARQEGIEPQGRLEHPNRPTLDLTTATDEEIEEWFSQR